jgi:hypothetical protein
MFKTLIVVTMLSAFAALGMWIVDGVEVVSGVGGGSVATPYAARFETGVSGNYYIVSNDTVYVYGNVFAPEYQFVCYDSNQIYPALPAEGSNLQWPCEYVSAINRYKFIPFSSSFVDPYYGTVSVTCSSDGSLVMEGVGIPSPGRIKLIWNDSYWEYGIDPETCPYGFYSYGYQINNATALSGFLVGVIPKTSDL